MSIYFQRKFKPRRTKIKQLNTCNFRSKSSCRRYVKTGKISRRVIRVLATLRSWISELFKTVLIAWVSPGLKEAYRAEARLKEMALALPRSPPPLFSSFLPFASLFRFLNTQSEWEREAFLLYVYYNLTNLANNGCLATAKERRKIREEENSRETK